LLVAPLLDLDAAAVKTYRGKFGPLRGATPRRLQEVVPRVSARLARRLCMPFPY
jgi:hypothetical protein